MSDNVCSVCGDELETEEEKSAGVCNSCSAVLVHDALEGNQLFEEEDF